MKRQKIIVWGITGLGKMVAELIQTLPDKECLGFIVDDPTAPDSLLGLPVLGNREYLTSVNADEIQVVPAAYWPHNREAMVSYLKQQGLSAPQLIHPTAWVSPSAVLGQGVVILAHSVIQTQAQLGDYVFVHMGNLVSHDVVIQDYVSLFAGCRILGEVQIARGGHLGAGAQILSVKKIGARAKVGIGSVVLADVAPDTTVMGNPARVIKQA